MATSTTAGTIEHGGSTEPDDPTPGWGRFERSLRAFAVLVVFVIVLASLLGVTGLRTRTAAASNGGLDVTVTFAQVTRSGIATPFEIDIEASGTDPLPATVEIDVSSDYLAMFDENGLDPQPDAATADGEVDRWTFEVPEGQRRLHVDFDARLQPNVHSGTTGTVAVRDPEGGGEVSVEFRTWVWG
ncbi:MAG: hypothetical protein ACYC2O_13205 [Microthrixaceae bacterium]